MEFPLFAGVLAAMLHVVSGPDHLAAVTPLAIEAKRKVWKIGFLWGFGHVTGMLLIGLLFLLFKEYLPLESISEHSEQLVGVVLIAVGLWALFRIFHKGKNHKHPHGQQPEAFLPNALEQGHGHSPKMKRDLWTSFGIGLLHGLAGVAHFILLLPVLGFEHQTDGLQYIFGFGFGTVFAMALYTALLGGVTQYSKAAAHNALYNTIRLSGGFFAVFVGIYWLYLSL
jgi:ABC-type nickel/cobalt efflux system permease component RcnA